MKRLLCALGMIGALGLMGSKPAHAWTKVKNNTNNVVFVSHAFASVSSIFCGWSDGCNGAGVQDWRVEGWWAIAGGGGSVTVHGSGYGNALHDIFAEDEFGHRWDANSPGATPGQWFTDIPQTAFGFCEDGITNNNPLPPRRTLRYMNVRGSRCCGGACPSNGTITLTL
jgi:uncharacterized membrane protein